MPSQRKRIGFLPKEEVQNIINQISEHNKFSQSKVTGILVEEALSSRGLLKNSYHKLSYLKEINSNEPLLISKNNLNRQTQIDYDDLNFDDSHIKDEVKMINDFIEFKFFKKIMNKSKKSI